MDFLRNTTSKFFQGNGLKAATAFLLVVCVLSFSGCGGGGGGSTPTTTTTTSTTTTEINYDTIPVVSTSGEGTVGTSGGKVTLEGAAVAVPENAVSGSTAISLQKITTDDVINTPPEVLVQAGNYYVVASSTTEFQKPVQVTIPYDQSVAASESDLAVTDVYIWNEDEYVAIPTEVDTTTKTLKALVNGLGEDVNVSAKRKKGLEAMTTSGAYVFKKDTGKINANCNGTFNGYYCECAPGTYWNNDSLRCETSKYHFSVGDNLRVLTANVGNIDPRCSVPNYLNKLCWLSVEENIANQIRKYNPDIVSIQERLPHSWCAWLPEDEKKSCALETEQIDRILGTGYDIKCISYSDSGSKYTGGSSASGYECIGIKKDFGIKVDTAEGFPSGLLQSCRQIESDTGPLKIRAQVANKDVAIFNMHTATPFTITKPWETINVECRAEQILQMFEETETYTLIMGDMNMDPFNGTNGDSVMWNSSMDEKRFKYHSGDNKDATPTATAGNIFDHVVSNFINPGGCATLTGTSNLDKNILVVTTECVGQYCVPVVVGGMDHNAILCESLDFSGTATQKGTISGTIKNALTGNGVSGVTLKFRLGSNIQSGYTEAATTTDADGKYTVTNLDEGTYTAEAAKTGYITDFFNVTSPKDEQNGAIYPVSFLSSGQTGIVLTWGSGPNDLDSHLTGPCPPDEGKENCENSRFHLYYPLSSGEKNEFGGSSWPNYVNLDVDDVTCFGPETTTILKQTSGTYHFSIHDFTNNSETYSTALSTSGARVKVYRGTNMVRAFDVPTNKDGTLWKVFELSGNNITTINTMSYDSSFGDGVQRQKLPQKKQKVSSFFFRRNNGFEDNESYCE